jgi:hypothetical protein
MLLSCILIIVLCLLIRLDHLILLLAVEEVKPGLTQEDDCTDRSKTFRLRVDWQNILLPIFFRIGLLPFVNSVHDATFIDQPFAL